MTDVDEFEAEAPRQTETSAFVVDIEGYEGPIDVLLALARDQKVDLAQISILQLADQYLVFVARARSINLELAADYLVMAAWLAYLKSRLLLPDLGGEDEPSGEEMAAALAFQLRRLEAVRDTGTRLMARPRLGREFFPRGAPERFVSVSTNVFEVTLYDLLKAYGNLKRLGDARTLRIESWELYSVEDALKHLHRLLGGTSDWESLWRFLPPGLPRGQPGGLTARSAVASTFAATLELARAGRLRLRQSGAFGPIYLRAAKDAPADTAAPRTRTREQDNS